MDQTVLEASEICSNGGSLSVGSTNVPHGPIPELFLSTRALSPSENDFANETLLDAKSRLLHLDIKLTRAQKNMAELQDQRTSLQRHIVRYLWLLSPVRRLPLEILWEIFMFCVPDDTELSWTVRGHSQAVMVPSQVCSVWRTAALSSPRLWSKIYLPSAYIRKGDVELTSTWLSRTGECPLWVKSTDPMSMFLAPSISELILPYSNQIQDLMVAMPFTNSLAGVKHRLSRLRTLIITGRGSYNPTKVLDTFELAAQLHIVKVGFYIPPSMFKPPWSQLTEFCMLHEFYSLDECLEILLQTPNLEKCELRIGHSRFNGPDSSIQLPKLRSLHLSTQFNPGYLFERLTLPSLREFAIDNHIQSWAPKQFASLLSRSSCSLHALSIAIFRNGQVLMDVDLIGCLERTPALVELSLPRRLSGTSMTANTMGRLTHQSSNTNCLVPNLQILRVYHDFEFDDDAFADMIGSRWWVAGATGSNHIDTLRRIHTVELIGLEEVDGKEVAPGVARRLNGLAGEGLNIYVLDKDGAHVPL